jgi:hypothetical protein
MAFANMAVVRFGFPGVHPIQPGTPAALISDGRLRGSSSHRSTARSNETSEMRSSSLATAAAACSCTSAEARAMIRWVRSATNSGNESPTPLVATSMAQLRGLVRVSTVHIRHASRIGVGNAISRYQLGLVISPRLARSRSSEFPGRTILGDGCKLESGATVARTQSRRDRGLAFAFETLRLRLV